LDEEKSKHAGLAEQNGLCLASFADFAESSKKAQQASKPVHLREKSVISMI
jgi:hypothetical protein